MNQQPDEEIYKARHWERARSFHALSRLTTLPNLHVKSSNNSLTGIDKLNIQYLWKCTGRKKPKHSLGEGHCSIECRDQ